MKQYRDNGAVGALLDEYEKSIDELSSVLQNISENQLTQIVDQDTEDEDCRSIETIMTHVISAGYNYAISIQNNHVDKVNYYQKRPLDSTVKYISELRVMFRYTENLFDQNPDLPLESYEQADKMLVSWGQTYDVEQLMEHAIVHILRHRRQIERFLLKLG